MSEKNNESSARGGIILMRHGEAGHNIENRYNATPGHPDYVPKHLTSLGREQARQTSDQLQEMGITGDNICQVVVSPLPRTQETANIIAGRLQVATFRKKTTEALIESQVGEREGQLSSDYNDSDPWFPESPGSFGGETREQVEDRVRELLKSIIDDSECDLKTQYVLIVSHGVPIFLMLELLTGVGEKISPASFRIIDNPSII